MFDISPVHLIVFAAIALLVVGPRRLPELARNLGRGVREMKSAISIDDAPASTAPPPASSAPAAPPDPRAPAQVAAATTEAHDDAVPLDSLLRSGDDQPERPTA